MTTLLRFSDPVDDSLRRGATIRLDSGEICAVSVAQGGVRIKRKRFGFFWLTIYEEPNSTKVAILAVALHVRFMDALLPQKFADFNLTAFANAIVHCCSCAELEGLLCQMTYRAAGDWPPSPWVTAKLNTANYGA